MVDISIFDTRTGMCTGSLVGGVGQCFDLGLFQTSIGDVTTRKDLSNWFVVDGHSGKHFGVDAVNVSLAVLEAYI